MDSKIKYYTSKFDCINVIGFSPTSDLTDNRLVRCDIEEIPHIPSTWYLLLKCKCGNEYLKRFDRLTDYCPECGYKQMGLNKRSDWLPKIESVLNSGEIKLIESLPKSLTWNTSIKLKKLTCGHEFYRRLDRLSCDCPVCNKESSYGSISYNQGYVKTRKYGDLRYTSLLEKSFIQAVDSCDLIYDFIIQPSDHVIPYVYEGDYHDYHPDAYLVYNSKKYLIEVKPTGYMLDDPIVQTKINAALIYCNSHDLTYSVITDDELTDDINQTVLNLIDRLESEDQIKNLKERNLI